MSCREGWTRWCRRCWQSRVPRPAEVRTPRWLALVQAVVHGVYVAWKDALGRGYLQAAPRRELGEAMPALLAELSGTAGWSALQRLNGVGQAAARPALAVYVVNAMAHMVTCELLEGATGMVPVAPPAKARHLRLAFIWAAGRPALDCVCGCGPASSGRN